MVSSYRLVWAVRVEPDELVSPPVLAQALRQDELQARVWPLVQQGVQLVQVAGLPDEQRVLVGLPVLVPDERPEPVWMRVLVPDERREPV